MMMSNRRCKSALLANAGNSPTIKMIRDLAPLLTLIVWAVVACGATAGIIPYIVERSNSDETSSNISFSCNSEIYCKGVLLDVVQMSAIFPDSKTFVDMKMKQSPSETKAKFDLWYDKHLANPSKEEIEKFVNETFEAPGQEFEYWRPDDWHEQPKFVHKIMDPRLKKWALGLNHLWLDLGRKMKKEVETNSELYSIIYLDHPVIVPGGRFREVYYWDSYWIMKGLLLSEMYTTTRGMLENFFSIIDRFGFIPNGGRIYYSMRSQPPLLPFMVKLYSEVTNDSTFAQANVDKLAIEFSHFYENYGVQVNGHTLYRYGYLSNGPRPESYREDVETASIYKNETDKQEVYNELKAAAESGMDFSSRWFISGSGTNNGSLIHLKTRSIVPVELNVILHENARYIAELYRLNKNDAKAEQYESYATNILDAIQAVLWHEDLGIWLDYDLMQNQRRDYFVPTNLSPLWTGCYHEANKERIIQGVLDYIRRTDIDSFPGGVPNTLNPANEQWDYPNVWPPMQHMLIVGLANLNDSRTNEIALRWATRWVQSNHIGWEDHNAMFEKYSCEQPGSHGGGGEYDVQLGFGWTNGVIMDLLDMYGDKIKASGAVMHFGSPLTRLGGIIMAVITLMYSRMRSIFG